MDIVGGDGIAAAEHIMSFDIKLVDNFPYRDLRDYYQKWYRPDLQATSTPSYRKVVDLASYYFNVT